MMQQLEGMLDEHRREMETMFGCAVQDMQPPPAPPPVPPAPAPDITVNSPPIDINLTIVNEDGPKTLKVHRGKSGKIDTLTSERVKPDTPADG
jgi:hypothetical protein